MEKWIALTALMLLAVHTPARADELPGVVFKEFPLAEESSKQVHELIVKGADVVYSEPREARRFFVKALIKVDKGAKIDEYDYLWAYYGLLKSSHEPGQWKFGPGTRDDYMKVARKMLAELDRKGQVGFAPFTSDGAFRMAAYREAANGLAWSLYDDGKADPKTLAEALSIAEKGEEHISSPEDYFLLDTKARILLKLGRQDEAFAIVRRVLEEVPDFADFADLRQDPVYLSWLKRAGKKPA